PRPPLWRQPITLDAGRWIINPGSVGQPRDGNPRACYALLNIATNVWEYRRVAYSVEETQRRMRELGLSKRLIDRLASGH
ncbi:MAG TPA: metallophosphoesterase, partial [Anaerolineae bacterium]